MKTKVLIAGGGPGRSVALREAEFAVPEIVAYLLAITQFRSRQKVHYEGATKDTSNHRTF